MWYPRNRSTAERGEVSGRVRDRKSSRPTTETIFPVLSRPKPLDYNIPCRTLRITWVVLRTLVTVSG